MIWVDGRCRSGPRTCRCIRSILFNSSSGILVSKASRVSEKLSTLLWSWYDSSLANVVVSMASERKMIAWRKPSGTIPSVTSGRARLAIRADLPLPGLPIRARHLWLSNSSTIVLRLSVGWNHWVCRSISLHIPVLTQGFCLAKRATFLARNSPSSSLRLAWSGSCLSPQALSCLTTVKRWWQSSLSLDISGSPSRNVSNKMRVKQPS